MGMREKMRGQSKEGQIAMWWTTGPGTGHRWCIFPIALTPSPPWINPHDGTSCYVGVSNNKATCFWLIIKKPGTCRWMEQIMGWIIVAFFCLELPLDAMKNAYYSRQLWCLSIKVCLQGTKENLSTPGVVDHPPPPPPPRASILLHMLSCHNAVSTLPGVLCIGACPWWIYLLCVCVCVCVLYLSICLHDVS